MDGLARWLFDPSGFNPHGFCLLWEPGLIWTHAVSDAAIGIAYVAISLALGLLAQKRRDLAFRPVVWLFSAFILLCASGHFLGLLTLWIPAYGLEALVKAATACVSATTAVGLCLLLPKLYTFPSPIQLNKAIAELQETNRQLRMAEQLGGVGHWRLELPNKTLRWSRQVFQVFGLDPAGKEPDIKTAIASYHPEDREMVRLKVERAIAKGNEYSMRARVVRPDGEVRQVESRGAAELAPDGSVMSLFGVFMDTTERGRAEEALAEVHALAVCAQHDTEMVNTQLAQLAEELTLARDRAERTSRAKSRFLAGMSHELRTPLNGILGYAELLRMEGGLDALQTTRVDAMRGAGAHLLEMINCVLDLSQIEAERLELHPSEIDLCSTASACLDFIRPVAEAKRIALRLVAASDVPKHLMVDPTRLRQVLLNLLGNAVKFTSHGSVELRLLTIAGGTRLRLEVADTGPGIPFGQRQQLFQEFQRLDTEVTSKIEGAGLGLALSTRLVALMGGCLGYEDNLGGGSVFRVELPLPSIMAPALDMAPASDILALDPASQPAHVLKVLVVDDVMMNREIAGSLLRADGHNVTCVEGGADAVAAVASTDFDVVLMDVRMPEVDGLEATRRIRVLEGPRGRVPIVALTAQAFAEQIAECHKAGMNGHLAKPFLPNTLLAAVVRMAAADPAQGDGRNLAPKPLSDVIGGELAVLDPATFDRTAAFLSPEAVVSHLATIAEHAEALLIKLNRAGFAGGC